jgi:hypothetical protein
MSRVTAWYVSRGSGTSAQGPFATDLVRAMLRDGQLSPMDLVYREGESEWRPVSMFTELKNVSKSSSNSKQSALFEIESSETELAAKSDAHISSSSGGEEIDIAWIVLRPHSSTYLQEGPFKTEFIREGLKKGTFQFSQYAWHVGMLQWMRIGDLSEFDRRSTPRDSTPHIPPPLPDPISAVLLEDDGDFESEEFQVALKPSKFDATPTAPMMLFSTGKESVAVGGAAAKIFEPNSQDLARVPWEERIPAGGDHSAVAQTVELIDDESSFSGYPECEPAEIDEVVEAPKESFNPQPFVPPSAPAVVRQEDGWEKWGRYVAAVGMGAVTAVFSGYLLNHQSTVSAAHVRESAERAQMGASAVPTKSVVAPQMVGAVPPVIDTVSPSAIVTAPIEVGAAPAKVQDEVAAPQVVPTEARIGIDMGDPMAGPEGGFPTAPAIAAPVAAPPLSSKVQVATQPLAPASAQQPPAQVPLPRVQVGASATNQEASIVGLKLNTPEAQVLFQGAFLLGEPLEVTFRGRLGEVLSKLNVRKTITINRSGSEIPSIKLKEIGLPDGAYTIEVSAGKIQLKSDLFLGKRDARFLDRLESHLRESSFELQAQKKVLFYAAQELDSLARDLGLNYGQLRSKPEMWTKFYTKWKTKVSAVERSIAEVSKRAIEDQAYPEETVRLSSLLANLKETSNLFEQGVGAQRDVASDSLTDLISELARQKEVIGSATSRAAPASSKGSSAGPTSKAL